MEGWTGLISTHAHVGACHGVCGPFVKGVMDKGEFVLFWGGLMVSLGLDGDNYICYGIFEEEEFP